MCLYVQSIIYIVLLHCGTVCNILLKSKAIRDLISLFTYVLLSLNSSLPGKNDRHFVNDFFKRICMNEKCCILICISQKLVPKGPTDNKSALIVVMSWCRSGDKPLPEPMLTQFTDAYMRQQGLTHWDRDKMAIIFQTTFSNAFSWMKMFEFQLRFHWSLFSRVQLIVF